MRLVQDRIRCNAGGKRAFVIGIALDQIAIDTIRIVWQSAFHRIVKENVRTIETGKLTADGGRDRGSLDELQKRNG